MVNSKLFMITAVVLCALFLLACGENNLAGEAKGGKPTEKAECSDGLDNDGDGFCDYNAKRCKDGSTPGDPDCSSKSDTSEGSACVPTNETCDGKDNDCDGIPDNGLPVACSLSQDCGTDGWTGTPVCINATHVVQEWRVYTCTNGGSCASSCSSSVSSRYKETCSGGTTCSDGVCQNETAVCGNSIREGGEVCDQFDFGGKTCADFGYDGGHLWCKPDCSAIELYGCWNATCYDTDGGVDPYEPGNISILNPDGSSLEFWDECVDSTSVTEYWCARNETALWAESAVVICEGACQNRACVNLTHTYVGVDTVNQVIVLNVHEVNRKHEFPYQWGNGTIVYHGLSYGFVYDPLSASSANLHVDTNRDGSLETAVRIGESFALT